MPIEQEQRHAAEQRDHIADAHIQIPPHNRRYSFYYGPKQLDGTLPILNILSNSS